MLRFIPALAALALSTSATAAQSVKVKDCYFTYGAVTAPVWNEGGCEVVHDSAQGWSTTSIRFSSQRVHTATGTPDGRHTLDGRPATYTFKVHGGSYTTCWHVQGPRFEVCTVER
jgi:hypothetical protein